MRTRLRALVIPVLIVVVAAAHGWRTTEHGESPWNGAGFGMFAEIDGPQRIAELELLDGEQVVVPASSTDWLTRTANFPSDAVLQKVVEESERIDSITISRPVFREGRLSWEEVASHDE